MKILCLITDSTISVHFDTKLAIWKPKEEGSGGILGKTRCCFQHVLRFCVILDWLTCDLKPLPVKNYTETAEILTLPTTV